MYIKYQYSIINQQSTLKQRGVFLHSSLSLLSLSLHTLFDLIWKNFIPWGFTYCIRYRVNNETLGQWGHVLLLNYHPIINTQQNPHSLYVILNSSICTNVKIGPLQFVTIAVQYIMKLILFTISQYWLKNNLAKNKSATKFIYKTIKKVILT